MPKTYQSKSIDSAKLRLTAAELSERNNLALLVRDGALFAERVRRLIAQKKAGES